MFIEEPRALFLTPLGVICSFLGQMRLAADGFSTNALRHSTPNGVGGGGAGGL